MRGKRRIFLLCILVLLNGITLNVYAERNESGIKTKWSYLGNTGPMRWGQLTPAFILCTKGSRQSPININYNTKMSKIENELSINYHPAPLSIVNDGTTELNIHNTQTIINDGHGIQVNFSEQSPQEIIRFKNKDYRLLQFHVHSPSENELNKENFPMEIHFVHQSNEGEVLVIAVFVQTGEENLVLKKIINHFPEDHGIVHEIKEDMINPGDLLPAKQNYYYFKGSLTTPPCTEGLHWVVMPNVIHASSAQIVLFRKAAGGNNARPIQPRNQRKIYFTR